MRTRYRLSIFTLGLSVAFLAGNVSANTAFASFINRGLVNAFSSVGQNLFGEAAFESRTVPPNPVFPEGSVQLYLANDVQLGTGMNVFVPPNPTAPSEPCRVAMQIRVVPPNPIAPLQIAVDPDVLTEFDSSDVVFESLADYRPSLARCEAQPVDLP